MSSVAVNEISETVNGVSVALVTTISRREQTCVISIAGVEPTATAIARPAIG